MKCLNCGNQTNNPKFCSKSCAVTTNNKIHPKRKQRPKTGKCKKCLIAISSKRSYCKECYKVKKPYLRVEDDITSSLGDLIYRKHGKANAYTLVRARARLVTKRLGWNTCKACGYNKHTETAHIKPISSFSEDTKISIINHVQNLICLCPNCHWEFDNGLIKI